MQRSRNHVIIAITKWPGLGADQIPHRHGPQVEIAPIRQHAVQRDDIARGDVQRRARRAVQLRRLLRVIHLPAPVDLVDHRVQGIPDGILGRDVDAAHLSTDAEVGAGVDAETGGAEDAVEHEFKFRCVGGVGGGGELGGIGPCLGDVGVQVALQADFVVGKCVVGQDAGGELCRVDVFEGGDHVGKRTGCHAPAASAVRDGQ